jgi:hypothetical protein
MIAALAACHEEDPNAATSVTKKPLVAKRAVVPQDPTAKMARAVTVGKPVAPIDLKYEIRSKPEAGTATEVEIALIPGTAVQNLSVTVSAADGVTLAGNLTASFKQPTPGEPQKHTFSMLPDRDGMFYITVIATTSNAGANDARTFSIPFIVGDLQQAQQQKPAVPAHKDSTGETIQSMKGKES